MKLSPKSPVMHLNKSNLALSPFNLVIEQPSIEAKPAITILLTTKQKPSQFQSVELF